MQDRVSLIRYIIVVIFSSFFFPNLYTRQYRFLLQGLVIAGLGDLQRPADKISIGQSSSLAVTGIIWTRYSLAITPKNWSLFSVNFFVACTALYQISRAIK